MAFILKKTFTPSPAQKEVVGLLLEGFREGKTNQVLLGVTGSGKTYTMALLIEALQEPTLVIAPNKTLAAQLCQEFKEFFPENAVEYFVSYYDYYQPEAYVPSTDTYIEKDFIINEDIDRMRLSATRALFERKDVIIVASVSCIYGLGSPETFYGMHLYIEVGQSWHLEEILARLVELQYERTRGYLKRGQFRVIGDRVELFPTFEESALRILLDNEMVTRLEMIDPLTGRVKERPEKKLIFPRTHYVTTRPRLMKAIESIEKELEEQYQAFLRIGKILEAQRLQQRTRYDIEMLASMGFCRGIENYSRHLDGRMPGTPPATLLDYYPSGFFTIIDESHITVPQLRGMFEADQSRKRTLVSFGFRLPSALDNRPLNFEEFEARVGRTLYVSATPGAYERERSQGAVVELLVRPTGLLDPSVTVCPTQGQMEVLLSEITVRAKRNERTLITTLTKRMAEDLTSFLMENGIRARYLHSDIDTLERVKILRDLRLGRFEVLVGVNLLREGLDLPEVSLVAVLDADKEGFLRSTTALIQISGRAARNLHGSIILFADKITPAIQETLQESKRRRAIQEDYNRRYGITPHSVEKMVRDFPIRINELDYPTLYLQVSELMETYHVDNPEALQEKIRNLEERMWKAADKMDFETAASIRDEINTLKKIMAL